MNKSEIQDWLKEQNVDFSPTATLTQLRKLYNEKFRELNQRDNNSVEDENSDNSGDNEDVFDRSILQQELQNNDQVSKNNPINRFASLAEEEADIDAQLRVLEKRRRLKQLQQELASTPNVLANAKFEDIQHYITPFAGDEAYDARKWLENFERACDSVNGDDVYRLKSIRRLMKTDSAAELFLRVDNSTNYLQFRKNFLSNFGHAYTVSEVIDKLRKTTFCSSKLSVMGYILKMQELAARANIDELQVIQFIIEGFQDNSVNIAVLYPACNIQHLKQLSHRYSQLRSQRESIEASIKTPSTTNATKTKPLVLKPSFDN